MGSAEDILEGSISTEEWNTSSMFDNFEERFHRLAAIDMYNDCEFIVGPQKNVVKGHKLLFSVASEVFRAMFYGQLKEDKPVNVEDLEPDAFKGMKTFIYTGKITFTSVFHAISIYIAARKYLIPNLTRECVKYVKDYLKPSDVLELRDCCKMNSIPVFDDLCCKIIQEQTDKVIASEYFPYAKMDTIELILKSPSLKLNSEIEVFDHFERWALAEIEREEITGNKVASRFNNLKKHIRFLTLSADEIVTRVADSTLLTQDEKYSIALNKMKFNPKLTSENISMLQVSRKFDASDCCPYKHMFEIPINSTIGSSQEIISVDVHPITLASPKKVKVGWRIINGNIFIKGNIQFQNVQMLLSIKSKFRVLAVNKCDDIFFENESKCIVNWLNNGYGYHQNSGPNIDMVMLEIPINCLKNGRFYRNPSKNVVSIEGSFKIDKVDF